VPIVVPGERIPLCIVVSDEVVNGYKVFARIKDENGYIIVEVEVPRLADTPVYCGHTDAPQQPGDYVVEYVLKDQQGNVVKTLDYTLLSVYDNLEYDMLRRVHRTVQIIRDDIFVNY